MLFLAFCQIGICGEFMPVPGLAIASGLPLLLAAARYLYDNPQRVLKKATEGLELASSLALAKKLPLYGASLAARAGTRLFGWQEPYQSITNTYHPRYPSDSRVFSHYAVRAKTPYRSYQKRWKRQKIWPRSRKTWRKKTVFRGQKTKKSWRSIRK